MRRGIRNPGCAPRRHLLAEHRHHLGAEQLDLLERHLDGQRQAVEGEQLALVVAEPLLEREGLVDDLLRAADAQRRARHEVVERAALEDRVLLEVRPERGDGVLRTLGDERLAAEADDRLVPGAVTVVLEPIAVEVDERLEVEARGEDVVREVPVAVVGGLLGDLGGADRAVPHERRHVVERARRRGEALQRGAEAALPVDDVLTPEAVQEVVVLERQRDALADVLAEPRVNGDGVAATHHEVEPALRHVLEHGVVLGELHRVVRGDQGHRGAQRDLLRQRRDVREQRRRRRRHERGIVVLAEREHVEADLVGSLCDADEVADALRFALRVAGGGVGGDVADAEDAELHGVRLSAVSRGGCNNMTEHVFPDVRNRNTEFGRTA